MIHGKELADTVHTLGELGHGRILNGLAAEGICVGCLMEYVELTGLNADFVMGLLVGAHLANSGKANPNDA